VTFLNGLNTRDDGGGGESSVAVSYFRLSKRISLVGDTAFVFGFDFSSLLSWKRDTMTLGMATTSRLLRDLIKPVLFSLEKQHFVLFLGGGLTRIDSSVQ
jgi:hypothetical protein